MGILYHDTEFSKTNFSRKTKVEPYTPRTGVGASICAIAEICFRSFSKMQGFCFGTNSGSHCFNELKHGEIEDIPLPSVLKYETGSCLNTIDPKTQSEQ